MACNNAAYNYANDPLLVPCNTPRVKHILATVTDKNEQIDAICAARGCIQIDATLRDVLDVYLDGNVPVNDTVDLLAPPIEEAYSSADQGYLLWDAEDTARHMRPLCATADESLRSWGLPVSMCEPDPERRPLGSSLESRLWVLWFGVIHASRKLDWTGEDNRMTALVALVHALQIRPDPPAPANATPAFFNHCVVRAPGALWSKLCMLGPSAAEMQSEAPGGKMGFTDVEARAWENENAMFAMLTAAGTVDFMGYGVWAMRDALEGGIARRNQVMMTKEFKAEWVDITLGVVCVWLGCAGEEMYARGRCWGEAEVVMENGMSMEWKDEPTAARWEFWKMRLGKSSCDDVRSEKARSCAIRALERMQDIEARFALQQ